MRVHYLRAAVAVGFVVLVLGFAGSSLLVAEERDEVGHLRVVSVRKMTPQEYRERVQDAIGAAFIVRLRFDAPVHHGVFVYAPFDRYKAPVAIPYGYRLTRQDGRTAWSDGMPLKDPYRSPGFHTLSTFYRCDWGSGWIFVDRTGALEWEIEIYPVPTGAKEAQSIFIKTEKDSAPIELISDWYETEAASSSPTGH